MNIKNILLVIFVFLTSLILYKNLSPFYSQMFYGHDETQAARVHEFTQNLKNFKIPPRIAPNFSFNMGYPVFNFYAPTAYWITSGINLLGFNEINSLKISYLLAILFSFTFCYLFLKAYFDIYSSIFGSLIYVSSLYFAIDIFIRNNLAETWFLAFVPLALYSLNKLIYKINIGNFLIAIFSIYLLITVHNILSIFFIPAIIIFILINKNKKIAFLSFFLAILLAAYYFLPLFTELKYTYANQIATTTHYWNHFLCIGQLWDSTWGFGGSALGCLTDGMPFKIGKPQIIMFILGLITFILIFNKQKKYIIISIYFLFLTISSLFLTIYQSEYIWNIFSPIFSVIQFPWRFIAFSLIGIAFFSSLFIQQLKPFYKIPVFLFLSLSILLINSKYFYGKYYPNRIYEQKFISESYISNTSAFKIPEYLPRTADYKYWINNNTINSRLPIISINDNYKIIKNDLFIKEIQINQPDLIKLNIHYFPFWKIKINNKEYIPTIFDKLGRPIIYTNDKTLITFSYNQTFIEKVSNFISFSTVIIIYILIKKKLWQKILKYLI